MTQAFNQGEPILLNDPIEVLSDTSLTLPETLSLPSTPSLTQISQTPFPPNFLDIITKVTDYLTGH